MPFGVLEWRTVFTHPDRVQIQLEVPTYRQQTRGVRWYGDVILEGLLHERHGGHRLTLSAARSFHVPTQRVGTRKNRR